MCFVWGASELHSTPGPRQVYNTLGRARGPGLTQLGFQRGVGVRGGQGRCWETQAEGAAGAAGTGRRPALSGITAGGPAGAGWRASLRPGSGAPFVKDPLVPQFMPARLSLCPASVSQQEISDGCGCVPAAQDGGGLQTSALTPCYPCCGSKIPGAACAPRRQAGPLGTVLNLAWLGPSPRVSDSADLGWGGRGFAFLTTS